APAKARAEGGRGRERTGRGPGGEEPATKGDREQTSPEAAGGPTQAANRKGDGRTQHRGKTGGGGREQQRPDGTRRG
ncbi:HNH endonuclease, partial [Mycobacterium tuberculosis]